MKPTAQVCPTPKFTGEEAEAYRAGQLCYATRSLGGRRAAGMDVTGLSVQGFLTSQLSLVPTRGTPHLFATDPLVLSSWSKESSGVYSFRKT